MNRAAVLLVILFCTGAFAQFGALSEIVVYVRGDLNDAGKRELGWRILDAFDKSGRFATEARLLWIEEWAMDDNQVLGAAQKDLAAEYICIVDVTSAFGSQKILARVLKVKTAEVGLTAEVSALLNDKQAFATVSNNIVNSMFGISNQTPTPAAIQEPASAAGMPPNNAPTTVKGPVKASVYITGLPSPVGNALNKAINSALMKTGIYESMENINTFVSGAANDAQLISAGKQADVGYVFVINVGGQISIRILDVKLDAMLAQISINGQVTVANATVIAAKIVDFILKSGPQADPDMMVRPRQKPKADTDMMVRPRQKPKDSDGYFALTYLPVATPVFGLAGNLQGGWVWGDGMFLGGEFMIGIGNSSTYADMGGLGLNFGNVYAFSSKSKLVYGISGGSWFIEGDVDKFYIMGPFIKYRYHFLEFSSRALIGNGFSGQAGVGLYFEGSKRFR